jgi:hypothetical protein
MERAASSASPLHCAWSVVATVHKESGSPCKILIVARLAEVLTRPLGGTRGSPRHTFREEADLLTRPKQTWLPSHIRASLDPTSRVTLQLRCVAGPLALGFRAGPTADLCVLSVPEMKPRTARWRESGEDCSVQRRRAGPLDARVGVAAWCCCRHSPCHGCSV